MATGAGGPKYGVSTYGMACIIDEGINSQFSALRHIYILFNVLLLLAMTIQLTKEYLKERARLSEKGRKSKLSHGLLNKFFIAFTINNLIRGSHMVDHTYRPVYYYELRLGYEKLWVTEMEIPTYANILISAIGYIALHKVMKALTSDSRSAVKSSMLYMALFMPATSFNMVHYIAEPPRNYGPFANFNIAGSLITAIPILVLLIHTYIHYEPTGKSDGTDGSKKQLLKSENNEEEEAYRSNRDVRRRSKTPVRKVLG